MNHDALALSQCVDSFAASASERIKKQKVKVFQKGELADFSNEITDDWYMASLFDVTHLITCGVAKRPNYVDEGVPFLSAQNARPFKANLNKIKFITKADYDKLTVGGAPEKNDILYTRVGNCGEAAKVEFDFDFAVYVSLTLIKPVRGLLNSDYLVAFLNSQFGLMQAGQGAIGIGLKNLNVDNVRRFVIPLPPLAEQKVIADKLDELLAQVESTKARLDAIPAILKSFRQSVLAAAVSGKLTEEWREVHELSSSIDYSVLVKEERKLKGFKETKHGKQAVVESEPFIIPYNWQWLRLGHIALKITDGAHNTPQVSAQGYPYLMAKNLTGGNLDFSENKCISEKEHRELFLKCLPEIGDLLVVNIGAGTGNNVLIDVEFEFSFKNIAIIKKPSFVIAKYLKHFFDAQKQRIFDEQTRGGAQPFLSLTVLNDIPFALPPINEQTEIVRRVEELFAFADKVEAQVNAAQTRVNNLTQSILAKAFRGELTADWRAANPELISGENSASALLKRIKAERAKLKPTKKTKA